MATATLQVTDLHVICAQTPVLNGVSLYAMAGEVITLLGRDGSGRQATLRAIIGQTQTRQGSIRIIGKETIHDRSPDIRHLGLDLLPAESNIVSHLTCEENLLLSASEGDTLGGAMSLTQIYELCPDLNTLRHTLGTRLSRAEKRMLAVARMLRTGANVLLMDDVTNGLSPVMAQAFANMIVSLKQLGYTIIMGERRITLCTELADRFYVIDGGQIIDVFERHELGTRREELHMQLHTETFETH